MSQSRKEALAGYAAAVDVYSAMASIRISGLSPSEVMSAVVAAGQAVVNEKRQKLDEAQS
jgi:hypothetical protein